MPNQRIERAVASALIGACMTLLPTPAAAAPAAAAAAPTMASGRPMTVTRAVRPAPPNIRGTVALPAKLSLYAGGWERARRSAAGDPRLARIIAPARSLDRGSQIGFVQAAVHRNVRWISDATEYGRRDYWASPAETLSRGRGDMEDRAILKMEALKNLGFSPRDLFMTVGRDRVAGPVTGLIVRLDGRYLMLDDTGAPPLLVDSRPDFEPMMTLGHGGSWLHGRRRLPPQLATGVAAAANGPVEASSRR